MVRKSKPKQAIVVYYVCDAEPKAKTFKTMDRALEWADQYTRENPDPMQGYWVDQVVSGTVVTYDGVPPGGQGRAG